MLLSKGRSLPAIPVRVLLSLALLTPGSLWAQSASQSAPSAPQSTSSSNTVATRTPQPPQQKPPALIDPAGPQISLQTSEALFDIAVALNACGYDAGLDDSDPVRRRVRDEVNASVQSSPAAQDARDSLCSFIHQHRLSDSSHDLAQYVSLALYVTPPPELTTSVELPEMPPDSTQVVDVLPLLRKFADTLHLHAIWVNARPQYDEDVNRLHDPLTRMIVETNAYLKMPATVNSRSRFAVVLEPMLAPGQTNARVYGTDYVVVASPVNGQVRMDEVRHTYLHYELEPLLYARASSMDRLLPVLKTVRDAPLDYTFRSDIVSLVIECMIRAVEARTMDTGVAPFKMPASVRREDIGAVENARKETAQKAEAARHAAVLRDMSQGYVLTGYFYNRLAVFEREPQSFQESIGEMVYGMDVPSEMNSIKNITFAQQSEGDVVRHSTRQLHGLDLAEMDLMKGDVENASRLAQQALDGHTGDPARASFILARCAVLHSKVADAQHDFEETVRLSKDPRLLAWSHIYLGRIYDLQDNRDSAVTEYRAALNARDGQVDTKEAAERGLKAPYGPPPGARTREQDGEDNDTSAPSGQTLPPAPQNASPHP